jgi:predicted metal-dependent peptidase
VRLARHLLVDVGGFAAEGRGPCHVGRHVTDAAGEPTVLDWRALLSRKFCQASAKDPQEVKTALRVRQR